MERVSVESNKALQVYISAFPPLAKPRSSHVNEGDNTSLQNNHEVDHSVYARQTAEPSTKAGIANAAIVFVTIVRIQEQPRSEATHTVVTKSVCGKSC